MELNIETLVEAQVKREMEDIDLRNIIEAEVRDQIRKESAKEIIGSIHVAAKEMITEEIRKALDGEVKTNDGWGTSRTYPSFEELFRTTFKKAMDEKYEVKKEIEKQVAQRVTSLVKQDYNKVIEKIVDEISGTKLVKKEGQP